jgi:hypothetical protein
MSFLFDGPQFHPADLEPLQGDGERVRSAGRMLHDAAGALDFARRAASQLQTLTDGVSWRGAGFQAFKGGLEKQPLPEHLVNARNVLGWTGDELGRLATKLDDIQADLALLRQRADLLGIDGDVPEERRHEVDTIKKEYEDLKERRKQALEQAAHVFDEMTDKTVFAKPPPKGFGRLRKALGGAVNFAKDFAVGFGQGVVDIGKGIAMLGYLATPWGMADAVKWIKDNHQLIRSAISYAMHNPVGMAVNVGKVIIDYDTLRENPGRWLGKLAPQIAVTVLSAGAGGVASRSGAIAGMGTKPGVLHFASDMIKIRTDAVEKLPGLYKFTGRGWTDLTPTEAFKKGAADALNRRVRNWSTLGTYGSAQRVRYLLHTRKELPMWGKVVKKVPLVTATATLAAGREAIVQDVAGVITEGGIEAEQAQQNR